MKTEKLAVTVEMQSEIEFYTANMAGKKKLPLLVYLHNLAFCHSKKHLVEQNPYAWAPQEYRDQFTYLVPHLPYGKKWNPWLIKSLIDQVALDNEDSVDYNNIFLAGHSWGARGVWDCGIELPEYFAGLIAMSGISCVPLASVLTEIPILIFHDPEDPVVPISESQRMYWSICSEAKSQNTELLCDFYTLEGMQHNIEYPVLSHELIYKWMLDIVAKNK